MTQELLVGASRGDATILKKDQTIAALHGREAVGDDDQCPGAVKRRDRLGDFPFRLIVERRGRLVEDEHGGIAIEGAGDRDALPLTSG